MVNLYNERASQQGLEPSEMHAVVGDIAAAAPDPNLASPELFDLDLAVVGMGFHHFADPGLAAKRLVERLKKGSGVLLILDFLPHEPIPGHGERQSHDHQHGHDYSHSHSHGHDSRTHVNGDKGEDLVPSGYPKAVTKTVAHHGFSEEMIKRFFTEAGCVDVGIQVLGEGISFGEGDQSVKRKLFLARGTRSEAD
jgi:SAM-dependent methyltransferase